MSYNQLNSGYKRQRTDNGHHRVVSRNFNREWEMASLPHQPRDRRPLISLPMEADRLKVSDVVKIGEESTSNAIQHPITHPDRSPTSSFNTVVTCSPPRVKTTDPAAPAPGPIRAGCWYCHCKGRQVSTHRMETCPWASQELAYRTQQRRVVWARQNPRRLAQLAGMPAWRLPESSDSD